MSRAKWWCVCLVFGTVWVGGCAGGTESVVIDTATASSLSIASTHASVTTTTSDSVTGTLALEEVPVAFRDLATSMAGTPIFAVSSLPEGIAVAESWWPVIEGETVVDVEGPEANPRVLGYGGPEPEGQLLLSIGDGWLAVLENFRGDLGDVSGEAVGMVAGQSAYLYEVNGGWLVQWAFEGRWYGVFGRDVAAETVTALAFEMALVEVD